MSNLILNLNAFGIRFARLIATLGIALFAASSAHAASIVFATDPFAGTTALTTPGRQVVGNELFLSSFSFTNDAFVFDLNVFGVSELKFINSSASGLPTGGVNVIVLQDSDDDSNSATPFNAGSAANLIAAAITQDDPGFFVYWNSVLGLNRLVYSTNLNEPTADLKILARITSPTGQDAINVLPSFQASNFQQTPEPASFSLMALAAGALVVAGKLRRH